MDITCTDAGPEGLEERVLRLTDRLPEKSETGKKIIWTAPYKKEAFRTSGQVQYVASAGNFKDKGYRYTGVLQILRTMMNYDYLWTNIRVKGGAYGCMSGFKRNGNSYLVSYRDPHLLNTLEVFAGLPDYLRTFEADEETMTKYIIGTVSTLDTPRGASAKGAIALSAYYNGITEEMIQKERDQILAADAADIRALADMIEAALDGTNICVVGSESAIEKHKDLFEDVEALVQG